MRESVSVSSAAKFTRASLKHFTDSRILQGNTWDEIVCLIEKVREVVDRPHVRMLNPKQDKYPGSLLLGKFYPAKRKAIIVILDAGKDPRDIISLHYKKKKDFYRLAG